MAVETNAMEALVTSPLAHPLATLAFLVAPLAFASGLAWAYLRLRRANHALKAVQVELDMMRQLLQGFFDSAPAAMYVRDKDDRFAMINRWGAAVVGQTPEAMVGQPFAPFRQMSDADKALAAHERVMATGKTETEEWVYHLPGGDRIGLVTLFPIRDRSGEFSQIGGMIFDITEQKAMQAELGQTRAILESFVQHASFPFGLVDPHHPEGFRFVLLNPAARAYYSDAAADAIIAGDTSSMPDFWPEWEEKVAPLAARVIEQGTSQIVETQFRRHDGELRQMRLSTFPIVDQAGGIKFIGSAAADLTDIVVAQQNLARSQEAVHQSEKLAAMGQLIAGVAHELNNPLAVVLGRAELLHEQLKGTPQDASLQKLQAAADRCARIVKSFLALARQTGPRRVQTRINDLVDIALDLTGAGVRNAGIALDLRLAQDLPEIMVDDDQIVQVLINLVINARHALETVGQPRTLAITTRCDRQGDAVIVEVRDNGPGIPRDVRSRIFDPFFTTKAVDQGTGLGLSVCKGIVDSHGGSLDYVESRTRGALFRVTLPVIGASAVVPDVAPVEAPAPAARGRVLIIDDETDVAELLVDCLAPLALDCDVVESGRAALDRFEAHDYALVFSDVRMPDIDGVQLFHEVQRRWPAQADRFVFVSGDVLHRDFGDIGAASGRPIIEKPFNFNMVREAARTVLAQGVTAS